jgi:23S rRNA maturation-related 3'-5' exoribonuclease YhaM
MNLIDVTARYHALFTMISNADLREVVSRATPAYFFQCPGAMKHHHAHRHGLLLHTVEVTEVALSMYECNVEMTSQQGIDIIIVAGLLHDVAKCKEYVIASNDVITYGSFVLGHVLESVMWMYKASAGLNIEDETLSKLADIMLAHHGYAEWGTPERQDITRLDRDGNPKASMMQCILHSADMVSAENDGMPERVKNLLK